MAETRLLQRRAKSVPRAHSPAPRVETLREVPYWRRARRGYVEHWIAGVIVVLAFANAVRLLAQ